MGRVFLLGSGFSAATGAPLAKEVLAEIFLNEIKKSEISDLRIWLEQHLFSNRPDWLKVADFEEVISRLELFEKYTDSPLQNQKTLELKLNLLLKEFIILLQPERLKQNLVYYDRFAQYLHPDDIIITFNYDLVVEEALRRNNYGINYHLGLNNTSAQPVPAATNKHDLSNCNEQIYVSSNKENISVLKLHGSINLAFCPECLDIREASAEVLLCSQCNAPNSSTLHPFIIPPTLFKSYSLPKQRELWYYAYRYLSNAEEIVIIGYSLPSADILAVQLLDFAHRASGKSQQITVVNGPGQDLKRLRLIYQSNLHDSMQTFVEYCSALSK